MKNKRTMKKLFKMTSILVLLIGFGFTTTAQVNFGIKAGLNANNFGQSVEDEEDKIATKMKVGFHLGVVMDYGFTDAVSLNTGLIFISKGVGFDLEDELDEDFSLDGGSSTTLNYLEIPISIAYNKSNFQVYAGPYIGIGVSGRSKADYTLTGPTGESSFEEDISLKAAFGEVDYDELADDEGAFNGLDFGFNIGVGYEFGPVLMSLGYSLGLNDLEPSIKDQEKDDDKITNRVISLSGTYMF